MTATQNLIAQYVGPLYALSQFATMDPAEARIHKPMVLIVDKKNNPKSRHRVGEQGEQLQ